MTALYLASFFDDKELVELLLNNGANPDKGSIPPETDEDCFAYEDDSEDTPLLLACENKSIALVKLLLVKGADVNKRNRLCGAPLHVAVKSGDKEMVRVLLEWGANKSVTNASGATAVEKAREDGYNDLADFIETWEPLEIKEPVID
jgi:ankyrin repeat protein